MYVFIPFIVISQYLFCRINLLKNIQHIPEVHFNNGKNFKNSIDLFQFNINLLY